MGAYQNVGAYLKKYSATIIAGKITEVILQSKDRNRELSEPRSGLSDVLPQLSIVMWPLHLVPEQLSSESFTD